MVGVLKQCWLAAIKVGRGDIDDVGGEDLGVGLGDVSIGFGGGVGDGLWMKKNFCGHHGDERGNGVKIWRKLRVNPYDVSCNGSSF